MNKLQWRKYYREKRIARKEEWKDIEGYEGLYQVSNLGKIKSFFLGKNKTLVSCENSRGYLTIWLYSKGIRETCMVHRLVATMFIPNPENKPQINHKNGNKKDNRQVNLEWCTQSENMQHAYDTGLNRNNLMENRKFGKDNKNSRIVCQYSLEGRLIKKWNSLRDVEREIGIPHSNISNCCRGIKKNAGGFIWKYPE